MKIRSILLYCLAGFLLPFLFHCRGHAQTQSAPQVEVSLEPSREITVGDPIQLRLQVTIPKGWQIKFPSVSGTWGDFTVLDSKTLPPTETAEKTDQHAWTLQIAGYRPGRFEIPPLSSILIDPSGKRQELTTQKLAVEIVSVLKENTAELRDLKGQEALQESYLWLWWGLAGAVLAALAVWWARRWWQRRRRPESLLPTAPDLPPYQEAQLALEALQAGPVTPRDPIFYFHLSEIVRRMVGRQFHIPALEYTTSETLAALEPISHQPLVSSRLEEFLSWCDLIKFARHQPTTEEQNRLLAATREFILSCRQAWETAQSADPDGLAASRPSQAVSAVTG